MPRVDSSESSGDEEIIDRQPSGSKKRKLEDKNDDSPRKKGGTIVNDEGVEMHDLGNKRYISVSTFKGKSLINIREYYEKDGKLLPGKKGISLSQDQYLNLKKHLKKIDAALEDD